MHLRIFFSLVVATTLTDVGAIPGSKTSFGSFSLLSDRNEETVHQILEDDASALHKAAAKPGTNPWKIGTFYASCMDTIGIAARGTSRSGRRSTPFTRGGHDRGSRPPPRRHGSAHRDCAVCGLTFG